jgi:hypothetical protein
MLFPVLGALLGLEGLGCTDGVVDVGEIFDFEEVFGLVGGAVVDQSALGEESHLVAYGDVGRGVGDQKDRFPFVGEAPEGQHHFLFEARVEPRGRFVEEDERRVGQEFSGDAGALALPAAEAGDRLVFLPRELHLLKHFGNTLLDFRFAQVGRQPQLGCVTQGLVDGEVFVQNVVLGHVANLSAVNIEIAVEVIACEKHLAFSRWQIAAQGAHEGGFPRTAATDQRNEFPRFARDADVVQNALFSRRPLQGDAIESQAAPWFEGFQLAFAAVNQAEGADLHHIALLQYHRPNAFPVDEGAVFAVEVFYLPLAFCCGFQKGMSAGNQRRNQPDVGLTVAANEQGLLRGCCEFLIGH